MALGFLTVFSGWILTFRSAELRSPLKEGGGIPGRVSQAGYPILRKGDSIRTIRTGEQIAQRRAHTAARDGPESQVGRREVSALQVGCRAGGEPAQIVVGIGMAAGEGPGCHREDAGNIGEFRARVE